jgi:hypothetical protein
MLKNIVETKQFTIIYITKYKPTKFISVDECIKIICDIKLNLVNFKSLNEMYFPKYKLECTNNILISLEIISNKKYNSVSISKVLKSLFPTVFDSKIIINLNIKFFLRENKERLMNICHTILGSSCKPIIESITSLEIDEDIKIGDYKINAKIDDYKEHDYKDDEEELIIDDIIDNEHFQMNF